MEDVNAVDEEGGRWFLEASEDCVGYIFSKNTANSSGDVSRDMDGSCSTRMRLADSGRQTSRMAVSSRR